jgi:DNA-binding NtrC family response regulator
MASILVVEDDRLARRTVVADLRDAGFHDPVEAENVAAARRELAQHPFDLVLLDLGLPMDESDLLPRHGAGLELVSEIAGLGPDAPDVIVVTSVDLLDVAVDAMRRGARDYVQKPFDPVELIRRAENALSARSKTQEVRELRSMVAKSSSFEAIIACSPAMAQVETIVRRVARGNSTVLIIGETGTGKELIARAVHFASKRREQPLVTVNCPAIPAPLLESELFGHVQGAFTDARTTRRGKVEMANGGSLFLDEIGDMGLEIQAKVLRLIQEKEFERVGSDKVSKVDVRIIAATHRDLKKEVAANRFRSDLYYRLNVIPLVLPPLRDRPMDIPLLADHFLTRFNQSLGTRVAGFSGEAMALLQEHSWPGNVRELQNIVECLVNLIESDEVITVEDVSATMRARGQVPPSPARSTQPLSHSGTLREKLQAYERLLIEEALRTAGGNKTQAANLLGISRPALYDRLALHGLG